MPYAAPHRCAAPGCPALVKTGYCDTHKARQERQRGSSHARGYDGQWKKLRDLKLSTDPICQIMTHCEGVPANEVDHIIPIADRPELRLEWDNLQSACHRCHTAKTFRENSRHPAGSQSIR